MLPILFASIFGVLMLVAVMVMCMRHPSRKPHTSRVVYVGIMIEQDNGSKEMRWLSGNDARLWGYCMGKVSFNATQQEHKQLRDAWKVRNLK